MEISSNWQIFEWTFPCQCVTSNPKYLSMTLMSTFKQILSGEEITTHTRKNTEILQVRVKNISVFLTLFF